MVRQPKNQDVLHRFFTEVMVDAVGLGFGKDVCDLRVQSLGGGEAAAKRFLDYDAPPRRPFPIRLMQTHSAKLLNNVRIHTGRCGKIEDVVAAAAMFVRDPAQQRRKLLKVFPAAIVAGYVVQTLRKFSHDAPSIVIAPAYSRTAVSISSRKTAVFHLLRENPTMAKSSGRSPRCCKL